MENYKTVIRSAIAYGANACHTPTKIEGNTKGAVKALEREQNNCLKVALGAYKATAIRQFETEASGPSFDLYLTGRVMNSTHRLKEGPVPRFNTKIATIMAITARQRRKQERGADAASSAIGEGSDITDQKVELEWINRWEKQKRIRQRASEPEIPSRLWTFQDERYRKNWRP